MLPGNIVLPGSDKLPTFKFAVTAPSAGMTNTAFSFTVQAKDALNKDTPDYAGVVHFTSTDPAAVLPANTTLTNGFGTFSATMNTVGSWTITATDTVRSVITGTCPVIAITQQVFQIGVPSSYNQNLRSLYDASYSTPTSKTNVVFVIGGGVIAGGSGAVALNVGSWPTGATITLVNQSRIQGYGGNGANPAGVGGDVNGPPGGTALYTRFPLNLVTTGAQIWGGGGGGGGADNWGNGSGMFFGGGGGAGTVPGVAGAKVVLPGSGSDPANGTSESGGQGSSQGIGGITWPNGNGGDPGEAGHAWYVPDHGTINRQGNGGAAGYAIDGAGYLTWGVWSGGKFVATGVNDGDVRGSVG